MLVDSFDRKINYLRISVTSRCNFRCLYCMPNTPFSWEPKENLLSYEDIADIVERTKKGGAEIVSLLGTSAYFAPGKAAAIMVESILKDSKKIYPCATLLNGEYGFSDVVNGVPVMLGRNGVEKIIEVSLNETEKAQFAKSVESVKELINVLKEKQFIKD